MSEAYSRQQFQPKDEAEETEAWIEGLLRNKKKKKRKAKKPEDVDNPDAQPQEASNHSTEARTDDSITTEEEDIWEDPRVPPLKWAHERNKRTIIANLIEICESQFMVLEMRSEANRSKVCA